MSFIITKQRGHLDSMRDSYHRYPREIRHPYTKWIHLIPSRLHPPLERALPNLGSDHLKFPHLEIYQLNWNDKYSCWRCVLFFKFHHVLGCCSWQRLSNRYIQSVTDDISDIWLYINHYILENHGTRIRRVEALKEMSLLKLNVWSLSLPQVAILRRQFCTHHTTQYHYWLAHAFAYVTLEVNKHNNKPTIRIRFR